MNARCSVGYPMVILRLSYGYPMEQILCAPQVAHALPMHCPAIY